MQWLSNGFRVIKSAFFIRIECYYKWKMIDNDKNIFFYDCLLIQGLWRTAVNIHRKVCKAINKSSKLDKDSKTFLLLNFSWGHFSNLYILTVFTIFLDRFECLLLKWDTIISFFSEFHPVSGIFFWFFRIFFKF